MESLVPLARDLEQLEALLGQVLREQLGLDLLAADEPLHVLAARRREGDEEAGAELAERVRALSLVEARAYSRAYSIFFDLANLAEDRHRIRVLRDRERRLHPQPRGESIEEAITTLHDEGLGPEQMQALLDRMHLEPVFTAHPTEAKRRSGRARLRRLRGHLAELDTPDLLPSERERLEEHIAAELTAIWQTDVLRYRRPTVLEEVGNGLYFTSTLWEVVPLLYRDLERTCARTWPDHRFTETRFLQFGSWIGGDRDGNPNVTAEVTAETLVRHRRAALELHLEQCRRIAVTLGCSDRNARSSDELRRAVEAACHRHRGIRQRVAELSPDETYRRWMRTIEFRLEQTLNSDPFGEALPGAYRRAAELTADLELAAASLQAAGGERLAAGELHDWITRSRVFGFHLLRLDLRQEAGWLRLAMADILAALGQPGFLDWSEAERQRVLHATIGCRDPIPNQALGAEAREALKLFTVLADACELMGPEVLGGFVISLTRAPSDVLIVLWLAVWANLGGEAAVAHLPVIPLLETISDLRAGPEILAELLASPAYRPHLAAQGDCQLIMVGYSDSTKDGGFLAANWALYRALRELRLVADSAGVRPIFFHGRGGGLGRGGGPAAQSILSLPPATVGGALRLTEQGEILAERYDDPAIAYRHLEQLLWGTLLVSGRPAKQAEPDWLEAAEELGEAALRVYREFVEDEAFVAYFRAATPISAIEGLPMGSRPSRRPGRASLSDLRAIPYTFAWTQSRQLLTAWYGCGTAFAEFASAHGWERLREMHRYWPYFRALLDSAALGLAKADLWVARHYAALVDPPADGARLWQRLADEHHLTRAGILAIAGGYELLSQVPWLRRSVETRGPYLDTLNLIQVEAMRRFGELEVDPDPTREAALEELLRLTIGGLAAGVRTTG